MFSFSAMTLHVFVSKGRVPSLPKFVKWSKQPVRTNLEAGAGAKPVPLSDLCS